MSKRTLVTALLPPTYFFCLIVNIFFGSLVNETFSDLKFNVFSITGSIFSNKYVKEVVLIKGWRLELCYSSKNGGGYIFLQKARGW